MQIYTFETNQDRNFHKLYDLPFYSLFGSQEAEGCASHTAFRQRKREQPTGDSAGGPSMNKKTTSLFAVLSAGILLASGCSGPREESNSAESGEDGVIRFTFSPDPAWDWIQDQGILEEMEKDSGFRILQTVTWDEYGQFAGKHADVVSIGTYELQNLEQETGVETVTFGKFNKAKDVMITANPEWETVSDMPKGCKIAAESPVGNTLIWKALLKQMDNRELAEGSDDLELVTADYQVIPDLVLTTRCAAPSPIPRSPFRSSLR